MAKSQILKDLANKAIDIEVAFNRLLLFANDIGDDELGAWAEKELTGGYKERSELPEYRFIESSDFQMSGLARSIPKFSVNDLLTDDMTRDDLCKIPVFESIANIIKYADTPHADSKFGRDITPLARRLPGFETLTVQQRIYPPHFANMVAQITQKLLKVFMKLDKEYGNLDDLDIDASKVPQEKIDQTKAAVHQIIYNLTINNTDNSKTKIKSKKVIKDTNVGSGTQNISKTASLAPTLKIDVPK